MTTTSATDKVIGTGNDSAKTFSFSPLVLYASTDLVVTHVDADGVETVLSEGTGASAYAVVVASYPGTGSITYPEDEVTPLPTGEKLVMKRVLTLTQATDLQNQDTYEPEVLETRLDKITYMLVQLQEEIDRALKQPIGDAADIGELPPKADRLGKFLQFDATTGDPGLGSAPAVDSSALYVVSATDPGHAQGRRWLDISSNPWILKLSDNTDWIEQGQFNTSTNSYSVTLGPPGAVAPALGDRFQFFDIDNSNASADATAQKVLDLAGSLTALAAASVDKANDKLMAYDNDASAVKSLAINWLLGLTNAWTAQQYFAITSLTDATNVAWDLSTNQVTQLTLDTAGASRTVDNPTNGQNGATYIMFVIQDGTGSRTITWGTDFLWPGGSAPTLSTGAGAVDMVAFVRRNGQMHGVANLAFA